MALQRRSKSEFIPDTVFLDPVPQFVERPDITKDLEKLDKQVQQKDVVSAALSELNIDALPRMQDKYIQSEFKNIQNEAIESAYNDPNPYGATRRLTRAAIETRRLMTDPASLINRTHANALRRRELNERNLKMNEKGEFHDPNVLDTMNFSAYGGVYDTETGNMREFKPFYEMVKQVDAEDVLPDNPNFLKETTTAASAPSPIDLKQSGFVGWAWMEQGGVSRPRALAGVTGRLKNSDDYQASIERSIQEALFAGREVNISEEGLLAIRPEGLTDEEWGKQMNELYSAPKEGIQEAEGVDIGQKTHNWLQSADGQTWLSKMKNAKTATDALNEYDRYAGEKLTPHYKILTDPNVKGLDETIENIRITNTSETLAGNEMVNLAEGVTRISENIEQTENVLNNALANSSGQLKGKTVEELTEMYNKDNYGREKYGTFTNFLLEEGSKPLADAYHKHQMAKQHQASFAKIIDSYLPNFNPDLQLSGLENWFGRDPDIEESALLQDQFKMWMSKGVSEEQGYENLEAMIESGELNFSNVGLSKDEQEDWERWEDRSEPGNKGVDYYAKRYWSEYRNAFLSALEESVKDTDKAMNFIFTQEVGTSSTHEWKKIENHYLDQAKIGQFTDMFTGTGGSIRELFAEKHEGEYDEGTLEVSIAPGDNLLRYSAEINGERKNIYTFTSYDNMNLVRDFDKRNIDIKIDMLQNNRKLDETDTKSLTSSLYNVSQYFDEGGSKFNLMLHADEIEEEVEFTYPFVSPRTGQQFNFAAMGATKKLINGEPYYYIYYPGRTAATHPNSPNEIVDYTNMRVLLGIEKKITDILSAQGVDPSGELWGTQAAILRKALKGAANIQVPQQSTL